MADKRAVRAAGGNGRERVVIIGAGPAGLTAAYELLKHGGYEIDIIERLGIPGGISRTEEHNGNRFDIGGHRFFSKSERVMAWWDEVLPLMQSPESDAEVLANDSKRMLLRSRLSRIFFRRKFFDYPLNPSFKTLKQLGFLTTLQIGLSFVSAKLFYKGNPEHGGLCHTMSRATYDFEPQNLEEFFILRFGRKLYEMFFKDYTQKVWGAPCSEISAEWGAQRIKGLDIKKAVLNAFKPKRGDARQKGVETSLIDRFWYPRLGPGQLWKEVARRCEDMGAHIHYGHSVKGMEFGEKGVTVSAEGEPGSIVLRADLVISTMPMSELAPMIPVSKRTRAIAAGLQYRDFITVGLLIDTPPQDLGLKDNWIYIQEPDVKVGRLQIFNNWSPAMVRDQATAWVGLEYFCNEGDDIWSRSDESLIETASQEITRLGIAKGSVVDAKVVRVPKAYPSYFGSYERIDELRAEIDMIPNLFCVGRNGTHRYNNMDHSMLSAMKAVEIITKGGVKSEVWSVNADSEYHEAKSKESASV